MQNWPILWVCSDNCVNGLNVHKCFTSLFFLDLTLISNYLLSIVLKDKALLESNLSVRTMPGQMAPAVNNLSELSAYLSWLISDKLNKTTPPKAGSFLSQRHTINKLDRKLVHCRIPASNRHCPFFRDIFKCQIKYLHNRCVCREGSLGLDNLSQ